MPRKALTFDLSSATVRFPRINADQTTSELTAAQMLAALGGSSLVSHSFDASAGNVTMPAGTVVYYTLPANASSINTSRTITLAPASSYQPGQRILIADTGFNIVNDTGALSLDPDGSDTLADGNVVVMLRMLGWVELITDGVSNFELVSASHDVLENIVGDDVFAQPVRADAGIAAPNQGSDWTSIGDTQLVTKAAVNDTTPMILPIMQVSSGATANGSGRPITPPGVNGFNNGFGTIIPKDYRRFRVCLYIGFTSNPGADSFPVYTRFNKPNTNSAATQETLHGTRYGTTVYPDDNTGLPGTLTDLGAAGGSANTFKFISNWIDIPAGWISNAASLGFYECFGIWLGNNSGGSLTDNYAGNHAIRGVMEFKK